MKYIKFREAGTKRYYFMASDGSGVINKIKAVRLTDAVAASEAENARGQGFDVLVIEVLA